MPIPTWVPGQVLSASDVNTWFTGDCVLKPSGQAVTSSTALVNDSALALPVTASSAYFVHAAVEYNGLGGADIKWSFAVPAGGSGFYGASYTSTGGVFSGGAAFGWTDTTAAQGNGLATPMNIRMTGVLTTTGTAGNLQFRFAQNTSNGTGTTVMANSVIYAIRIA